MKTMVSSLMLMLSLALTFFSNLNLTIYSMNVALNAPCIESLGGSRLSRDMLVLSSSSSAERPAIQWNKTYGGVAVEDAYCVIQTRDGGYVLVGQTNSFGSGFMDCWLVKTDVEGNMEWNRTFGGSGNDYGYCILQTSDEGYAIAGTTSSFDVRGYDDWLVKVSSSGSIEWSKTFGGIKDEVAWSAVQTSDGGYALVGSTDSFGGGYSDVWLVKTDASGSMLWNKTYGGGLDEAAYSVKQCSDGGYAMAGYTSSSGAGSADFWLIKTDATGNVEWSRAYGGLSWDCAQSVILTDDGGYALAGQTRSFGSGSGDFWLVKTDSTGGTQWSRTYGGVDAERAYSIIQADDEGFVLAGFTLSFGFGMEDFWLVRTDSTGSLQWNRTFGGVKGDLARSMVQISTDEYVIAGRTWSFGAGSSDFWLVKVGSRHDVAVVAVEPSQTIVEQGSVVRVNVTVQNQGDCAETFNVIAYADSIPIAEQDISDLAPKANVVISFDWNTTTFALGTYTVSASASIVMGETDTADNTLSDGSVRVAGAPAASFTYWPEFPQPNNIMTFNATLSAPNGGTIINYTWNFGDTNITSTSDPIITHIYISSGSCNVTLKVTDDEGLADMTWKEIPVHTHDLAVISVNLSKTVVGQGYSACINVTVENQGDTVESFNLTLYADLNASSTGDEQIIASQTIHDLKNRTLITIIFAWNTTGIGFGNYSLWAYAALVLGETDIADNALLGSWICISIPGDINGDWKVNLKDIYAVARAYGSHPDHARWDPVCDINSDLKVDLRDYYIACRNYGKTGD